MSQKIVKRTLHWRKLHQLKNSWQASRRMPEVCQHDSLYTLSFLEIQSKLTQVLQSRRPLTKRMILEQSERIYFLASKTTVTCTICEMRSIASIVSDKVGSKDVALYPHIHTRAQQSLVTKSFEIYFHNLKSACKLLKIQDISHFSNGFYQRGVWKLESAETWLGYPSSLRWMKEKAPELWPE